MGYGYKRLKAYLLNPKSISTVSLGCILPEKTSKAKRNENADDENVKSVIGIFLLYNGYGLPVKITLAIS